ncbi:class I SAM-dependent methyltransferase [Dongia sp.]|uniref:class I SAM-dependent methyltransferase n=1 Tax=Dongia sp. TaxID=1977262 RepID=UPI0035AE4D1F
MTIAHDETFAINRARWDEVVAIHVASPFYRVKEFLAGEDILLPIERAEIGDIAGKSLVHLQCHFGLDTLALARRGATVTGLDFSSNAIAAAREIATRAGIDARFVEGNLYDAPNLIAERFDRAYVSWGAIGWLPDIKGWARVVAEMLKPGGELYLLEGHPFALALDQPDRETGGTGPLRPTFNYFGGGAPLVFEEDTTYTGEATKLANTKTHVFSHGIGEILSALLEAGLSLTYFKEHDSVAWSLWGMMLEGPDRMYRLPEGHPNLPVSFSLKARKV